MRGDRHISGGDGRYEPGQCYTIGNAEQGLQLGMLMFIVSNLVGSTIQITTLPLPVLSTLQAVCQHFWSALAKLI